MRSTPARFLAVAVAFSPAIFAMPPAVADTSGAGNNGCFAFGFNCFGVGLSSFWHWPPNTSNENCILISANLKECLETWVGDGQAYGWISPGAMTVTISQAGSACANPPYDQTVTVTWTASGGADAGYVFCETYFFLSWNTCVNLLGTVHTEGGPAGPAGGVTAQVWDTACWP